MTKDELHNAIKTTTLCKIEEEPTLKYILYKEDVISKTLTPFEINVELFRNVLCK